MKPHDVRVLDVGQCDYDHAGIRALLERHFAAEVDRAHTADDALRRLAERSYALVLVNRILDRTGDEGLDLLRRCREAGTATQVPMMLVSNYPEAQRAAVAAGALPGFGKAALHDPATLERLRAVLLAPEHQPR